MSPASGYSSASRHRLDALLNGGQAALKWVPDSRQPVVLYGGGNTGRALLALLVDRGIPVLGVLDQRGRELEATLGVRCVVPAGDLLDAAARGTTPLLLAVHNRDADVSAIASLLHARGWGRIITFPQVHAALEESLGERFWLGARSIYVERRSDVEAGFDRLADDDSRDLYVRTIAWRLTGEPDLAPHPSRSAQYFPEDLPAQRRAMRFVDVGAFDGDSLRRAFSTQRNVEHAWAFEPDPVNFRALVGTARELSGQHGVPIECWPCAVGAQSETLRFSAGQGEASRLDPDGAAAVQCIALDDALVGARPTFIKFVIEGAEPAALHGARGTIAHGRPRLAVCVYHSPEHLWSIGRHIEQLDRKYDLYLRGHGFGGFDLVLYAIPR